MQMINLTHNPLTPAIHMTNWLWSRNICLMSEKGLRPCVFYLNFYSIPGLLVIVVMCYSLNVVSSSFVTKSVKWRKTLLFFVVRHTLKMMPCWVSCRKEFSLCSYDIMDCTFILHKWPHILFQNYFHHQKSILEFLCFYEYGLLNK